MATSACFSVCYSCFLLLIFNIFAVRARYQIKDVKLPENYLNYRVFSASDIAKYDGSDEDLPIYMGVKGVVFDVSTGKEFYGKGSGYNALAGKDATRAVAMMSLSEEDLNNYVDDLDDKYLQSLDDIYESVYVKKYPVVGYMDYFIENKAPKSINNEL